MEGSPAQIRNAAARRLMARGRYREALDVLNEAIRMEPRNPESFENRAAVFERLGMYPQADADRRRVEALGGVRYTPPQPPAQPPSGRGRSARPSPPPATPPPATPSPGPAPASTPGAGEAAPEAEATAARPPATRYPVRPRRQGSGAAAFRALAAVFVIVGGFVAAGVLIFVALGALGDVFDGDDANVPGGGATETPTGSGDASATATEAVDDALSGSPLSFSRLQAAWQAKGITAAPGEVSDAVSGFGTTAVNVTLTKGASTMTVAVLLYDSPQEIGQDWNLGDAPSPKGGREIPAGVSVWYNLNAVIVVTEPTDAIRNEVRDAFFAISA